MEAVLRTRPQPPFAAFPFMFRTGALRVVQAARVHSRGMNVSAGGGPVAQSIVKALEDNLTPTKLELVDDSAKHASHAAMKGKERSESHFKLKVVSEKFEGLNKVARHRLVYSLLDAQFKAGLHALNIEAHTPKEASS